MTWGLIGNQVVLIQDFAGNATAEVFRSHVTEYVQHNNIGSEQSPNQTNTVHCAGIIHINWCTMIMGWLPHLQ